MLQVVSQSFKGLSGTVVLQGDTAEEVTSAEARNQVISLAGQNGLSRPGMSGTPSPYPVDAAGNCDAPVLRAEVPVAGYRCDYSLAGMP